MTIRIRIVIFFMLVSLFAIVKICFTDQIFFKLFSTIYYNTRTKPFIIKFHFGDGKLCRQLQCFLTSVDLIFNHTLLFFS